jgi:hypothetical protein
MIWPCKPRVIVVGVLLSALASSTLHALPVVPQTRPQGRTEITEIAAAAWEWLSALFAPRLPTTPKEPPASNSGQPKEGSIMDPDGGH